MRPAPQSNAPTSAAGLRLAIVVSRYHATITEALLAGATEAFRAAGGQDDALQVVDAPGTFELPVIASALASRDDVDGVIALGCVVRGETEHDRHIAGAVARGLVQSSIATGKPIAFGVLTCGDEAQARARAGGDKGNKGTEAMQATIAAVRALEAIQPEVTR